MDETTEEILKGFDESWSLVEADYESRINNNPQLNFLIPVYSFIRKLKQAGENKHFRLGTSMGELVISRSVAFRLRQDQKFIKIEAFDNSFIVSLRDGKKLYREYTIKDLDDERLTGLIQTLKSTLVD